MSEDHKVVSDGDALAQQVANALFAADTASRNLGVQIIAVRPGYAKLSMQVCADMLNGHGMMHGGLIFTLADSAFAFACNSHNLNTVAAGCSIEFLRPGKLGEMLIAEARETLLQGRHGIYDVTVTGQDGTLVAVFRGKSTQIKGTVLPTTG
jgi:acyl-CoA thioesterase